MPRDSLAAVIVLLLAACPGGAAEAAQQGTPGLRPDQAAIFNPHGPPPQLFVDPAIGPPPIFFGSGRSGIDAEGQVGVDAWASVMAAQPQLKLRLEGNADERGTAEHNRRLGKRRAEAVARALEARGVSAERLQVVSYGEERPVDLGHDEAAWSVNRRVDLKAAP